MPCDQILTILVNFAHTLDPNAAELFAAANQEFGQRLRGEFEALDASLILSPEHVAKILNVLLPHGQLQEELTEELVIHLDAHRSEYTPESLAELSIIYATKMPHAQLRNQFFDNMLTKFERVVDYIDEKTLYKFLWSFIKAGRLVIEQDALVWNNVRHSLQKRSKEFSPDIMTNIMVLSTKAKLFETALSDSGRVDFWDSMEPQVILNMKEMKLEELINLMWSSQKVKKGGNLFYQELEKELTKRI